MKLKHGLLCNTARCVALRDLYINAILISWEKNESVIHFIFVVCYCVCVKRITLCNCLCSSSPSRSCRALSGISGNSEQKTILQTTEQLIQFTILVNQSRSLKYMTVIRIRKNLSKIPFLSKR